MVGEPRSAPTFANIYLGTSTGSIKDVSQCLIGCRVVKDEQFGTIKYVGPIVNSTVVWLGIDWDNPKSGRHDGTFKGVTYFNTHHPMSGSFLKYVLPNFTECMFCTRICLSRCFDFFLITDRKRRRWELA